MKHRVLKSSYFVVFLFSMMLFSCLEDADCETESVSTFKLSFNKKENGQLDTVAFSSVKVSSIPDPDSVFFDLADSLKDVQAFPVDPAKDSVTLVFVSADLFEKHSLVLGYTITPRLISPDCGVEQIYSDLEVLSSDFDSVSVVNNVLNEDAENNIRVFMD